MKKILTLSALAGVLFLSGCTAISPIEEAGETCNVPVEDGAITFSGVFAEDEELYDVACVLYELDTPKQVVLRIDSTRGVDGVQTATWGSFEATWAYDGENGLMLIVASG